MTPQSIRRNEQLIARLFYSSVLGLLVFLFSQAPSFASPSSDNKQDVCEYGVPHSPHRDGINKTYCGRQISHIMGWQGSAWLERPNRSAEEGIPQLIDKLALQPGMVVADYGAGTGYLTRRFAAQVGRTGTVWAVDIQPQMLDQLETLSAQFAPGQIQVMRSTPTSTNLPPNSLDMAVMVDVYHELEFPQETLQSLMTALKPGGEMVFIEYRPNDPDVPIKQLHTMSVEQVRKEAESTGLVYVRTDGLLWQNMVRFKKPD